MEENKIESRDLVPIKLEAELDLSLEPNECRIKGIHGSPWADLGYWLEAVGWLATSAAKEKKITNDQMADYVRQYIMKCLEDYKHKSPSLDTE